MTDTLRRRPDIVFLVILAAALAVRVYLVTTQPYIHDEINNAIPLADTISFTPGALNLPLRGENHGALPAYVVKASGIVFGTSAAGYRTLHVLLGLATIVLVYRIGADWYGPVAGRWAAALLAFNEYYLGVSSRITAHAPHLFLIALSLWAFSRFLDRERAGYLFGAAGALGLAFYCKEHSVLLLPVFFAVLLLPRYRRWLRRPQPWLACGLLVLVLAPDLYWNAVTDWETTTVTYGDQEALQATYYNHLRRIGGVGLSPYPSMFYGRTAVRAAYQFATGKELYDETAEYYAMNPAIGALLLGALLLATVRPRGPDDIRRFLLIAFWGVFGFFTLIARGDPPGRLSAVSWMWAEFSIFPAVVIAGAAVARLSGWRRLAVWAIAVAALAYAVRFVVLAAPTAG